MTEKTADQIVEDVPTGNHRNISQDDFQDLVAEFTRQTNVLPNQATILELLIWSADRGAEDSQGHQLSIESIQNYHAQKQKEQLPDKDDAVSTQKA